MTAPSWFLSAALYLQDLTDLDTIHLKDTRIMTSILILNNGFTLQDKFVLKLFFSHENKSYKVFANLKFKVIVQALRTECLLKGELKKNN